MRSRSALSVAFGQVVRELREEAGLSQERLSYLAKLSRNYVGQVERGENSPTLDAVAALAGALGKPARELISAAEDRAR
jgi:transcriptional regulator with XRE-family HTH domain